MKEGATTRPALPIDGVIDTIRSALAPGAAVVVEATPGAGKTTRVPPALSAAGQRVIVLEPRRLAARLAATRVAHELEERLGAHVGYQVRFDSKVGPDTRLRFVTEGVLTRMLLADPTLEEFDTVVVDEIHERHLQGDLALALVDHLRRTHRPDLRLVAMSATVDGAALAERLGAQLVRCRQRQHDVTVSFLAQPDRDPLEIQIAKAVRQLANDGLDGHVLAFLPGAAEIRRAAERCEAVARDHDLAVLPLYGALSAREQDAAVAPSDRRKVVLATNVAESSITIAGVAAVIDSGLVKRARHEAWAVMPELRLESISKASADQRAGRAGRTQAGRCLRLYTEAEHHRFADFDEPEIVHSELSEAVLACRMARVDDPLALPWLTTPPEDTWHAAERLLGELGALDADGQTTELGRRLAALPLPPRLGRALIEASARGVAADAATALAILAERGSLWRGRSSRANLWEQVEAFDEAKAARFDRHVCDGLGVDGRRARSAERACRQLLAATRRLPEGAPPTSRDEAESALGIALLSGFPDRVGKRGGGDGRHGVPLALSSGGAATVRDEAALSPDGLCLVLDARRGGAGKPAVVHLAAPLGLDALIEGRGDSITDEEELLFVAGRDRVESIARLRYGRVVLEETRGAAPPSPAATAALLDEVFRRGPALVGGDGTEAWLRRARFAAKHDDALPSFDDDALRERLAPLVQGMTCMQDLTSAGIENLLTLGLDKAHRQRLDQLAPRDLRLASGQALAITYPDDAPPFVESYLQDFFGLPSLPAVAGEPIVVKLWAPNGRPMQVTDDLPGFWTRLYPQLRRELGRRYPKHHWPEDPSTARPVRLKRHLE